MKKFAFVLLLALSLSLCACGASGAGRAAESSSTSVLNSPRSAPEADSAQQPGAQLGVQAQLIREIPLLRLRKRDFFR